MRPSSPLTRLLVLLAFLAGFGALAAPAQAFGFPSLPFLSHPKQPAATTSVVATPSVPVAPTGARHHLVDIQVQGNDVISAETIMLALPIHVGDTVTDSQIQDALEKVYGLGYFTPDIHAAVQPLPGGERLIILVHENPILNKVVVTGATIFPPAKLEGMFQPQLGKILDLNDLHATLKRIEDMYADQGYILTSVVPQGISPDGTLTIQVLERRIQAIKIEGNVETKDFVIRREITQKPGDIYNFKIMQDDLRRVYNLNYFDDIGLKYEPGSSPDQVIVVVTVKEKQTGTFQLSAGYSSLDGPLLIGSIKKDDLFGLGQSIDTSVTISRSPAASINYYNPWIDNQHDFLGAGLYLTQFYNLYALVGPLSNPIETGLLDERRGGFISFGRPLFGNPVTTPWRQSVQLKMERIHELQLPSNFYSFTSTTVQPAATLSGTGWDQGWSGSYTLTYDSRDYVIDPHDGWFDTATVEQYVPYLGNLNDTDLQLQVNRYIPLPGPLRHTLAIGTQVGDLFSFSGQSIPPYLDFYSTGNYLLRGWQEGYLGGNSFFLGSIEYRFPVYSIISGVAFYDNGLFWDKSRQPFSWNLEKAGYGLGIRLNTPLGPLRLDYGWPFNPDPNNYGGKLYFSIGQKF